jgi:hypothetical protein
MLSVLNKAIDPGSAQVWFSNINVDGKHISMGMGAGCSTETGVLGAGVETGRPGTACGVIRRLAGLGCASGSLSALLFAPSSLSLPPNAKTDMGLCVYGIFDLNRFQVK